MAGLLLAPERDFDPGAGDRVVAVAHRPYDLLAEAVEYDLVLGLAHSQ